MMRIMAGVLDGCGALSLSAACHHGRLTSHELKRRVAGSVGYFWSIPHSQLYAEPARLASAGLLASEQETSGRPRRSYTVTGAGRRALAAWLSDPSEQEVKLRNPGLLQLFLLDPEDAAGHPAALTLCRGRYAEDAAVRFWSELRASVDGPAPASPAGSTSSGE